MTQRGSQTERSKQPSKNLAEFRLRRIEKALDLSQIEEMYSLMGKEQKKGDKHQPPRKSTR